jgi:hypothetical protein
MPPSFGYNCTAVTPASLGVCNVGIAYRVKPSHKKGSTHAWRKLCLQEYFLIINYYMDYTKID